MIRTPWPEWIAKLERTRYDNSKFVPVELLSGTSGYDSECAVLFPETVSVAGRAVNNFGAIFCDREAERLRRVAGAAAELLRLNLPPDAAVMLTRAEISQQAYILWDLIHDRSHSHGDLPFDPFMVRQRAPYWMYALEELRCDLTAFGEAVRLERDGIGFARHIEYAILLDRLLRFPITGARKRNYDGLGGQLLFAYLHRNTGPTISPRSSGSWSPMGWASFAGRFRRCTGPGSTEPSSSAGPRPMTWSRPAFRRPAVHAGRPPRAGSPISKILVPWTWRSTTSSRYRSSTALSRLS